jgi:hypothetical protein
MYNFDGRIEELERIWKEIAHGISKLPVTHLLREAEKTMRYLS